MPIEVMHPIEPLSQQLFSEIASEVVGLSFEIHNDLGRLLEEKNYRKELKRKIGCRAHDEIRVTLSFGDFRTSRFIDFVVDPGGVFELKTVARISDVHRAQLVNYLFLTDSTHGKIINFRPNLVEQEFVNATATRLQRTAFEIADSRWKGCPQLREQVEAVLRDWGTGLCTSIYLEVIASFLGGLDRIESEIPVLSHGQSIGNRKVRLSESDALLKVTTLERDLDSFEWHARRLLKHTTMKRIDWINIARDRISFRSLER